MISTPTFHNPYFVITRPGQYNFPDPLEGGFELDVFYYQRVTGLGTSHRPQSKLSKRIHGIHNR